MGGEVGGIVGGLLECRVVGIDAHWRPPILTS